MNRTCGLLLHPTSLPGPCGMGDIGPDAVEFAAFLARAGQSWWQLLPLTPTDQFAGNSPYSSLSAFAGNPLLVSPRGLFHDGLLTREEYDGQCLPASDQVDFGLVTRARTHMLELAFTRARKGLLDNTDFGRFLHDNGTWLNDFALFLALKKEFGLKPWHKWPEELALRHDAALRRWGEKLALPILFEKFRQYCFFRQWDRLRKACADLGIGIIGDAPIYVTFDSPDVWCNRQLFKLGEDGLPMVVAGVPPDYFAKNGQRWGNPVYDWEANQARNFDWWTARLAHNFGIFDQVRLDHFRGFAAHWEIPAREKTAKNGRWIKAPGRELLETARTRIGRLPLIAEDLGIITDDVTELRQGLGLPGMRVLQFGFGRDMAESPHQPHHFEAHCVAYTGTHDNNTTRGWFEDDLDGPGRDRLAARLGHEPAPETVAMDLARLAFFSIAEQAILPVQDLLGLPGKARMNTPGRAKGNWAWRLLPDQLTAEHADRLSELAALADRCPERRS